jgi:hypothetical protein
MTTTITATANDNSNDNSNTLHDETAKDGPPPKFCG